MKTTLANLKLAFATAILISVSSAASATECVILLHGLARTADSMQDIASTLEDAGYKVVNVDYPSREQPIDKLADLAIGDGLDSCKKFGATPVNFVTHSLGGILVRHYYSEHETAKLKRVVMLGPPNNGSEVVDNLKDLPPFEWINGPAGLELGTDKDSTPVRLGAVNFELGIIAGTRSVNPVLSSFLPNPDDGKVSLESAKIEGMCSFLALPTTHPFMMNNQTVINEVVSFLDTGKFTSSEAQTTHCERQAPAPAPEPNI